jgi:hypothetical protein
MMGDGWCGGIVAPRRRLMDALHQIFADARGYRKEAVRARKLAETARGQLQGELLDIATLYEVLADGKDPDEVRTRFAYQAAHRA